MVIIPVLNYQKKFGRKEENGEGGFAKGGMQKLFKDKQCSGSSSEFSYVPTIPHLIQIQHPHFFLLQFSLGPTPSATKVALNYYSYNIIEAT